MPDINPILEQARIFRMQTTEGQHNAGATYQQLQDLASEDAVKLLEAGNNAQIVQQTQDAANLATQAGKMNRANELGINPKARSDALTALADTIASAYREVTVQADIIAKKQSVSPLERPLEWLVNQFTVNTDIRKHNTADRKLDAAVQQYQRLNTLTQSAAVTQTQLAESVTAASAAATAKNIAIESELKANESLRKGLLYNVQGISTILQMKSQDLSTMFSIFNAQQAQEQFNLALANADRQREEFDWRKNEKKLLEQGENLLIERINAGRMLRLGADAKTLKAGTAEAKNAISLLSSNSPVGKELQDDYMRGEQGVLATSPANALETFKTSTTKIAPAQYAVRQLLEDSLTEVQKSPSFDPKNVAATKAAINQVARAKVDQMLAKVNPDDPSNIFNIPAIAAVIKNVPELQQLPVVVKVLAPRIAAGDNLNRPDDVFQAIAGAVKDKTITYVEALDAVELYQRGVALNLASRNIENFGVTPSKENSKFGYRVGLTTDPRLFASKKTYDLTKVDAFGRALNEQLMQSKEIELLGHIGEIPGVLASPATAGYRVLAKPKAQGSFYSDLFDPKGYGFGGQ